MSDTLIPRPTGSPTSGDPASRKVRHRPSWILFVVLGAVVCLGMGLWQLARYQEASGTVQNLGYTFMWPFLAGFLVYAYVKYIRLEADAEEEAGADPVTVGAGSAREDDDDTTSTGAGPDGGRRRMTARPRGGTATEIPADLLPTRRRTPDAEPRDEGLEAYNSYLAELARRAGDDSSQEKSAS